MESHATTHGHADLVGKPLDLVRSAIRANGYSGHTAGICANKLQCNLVVLQSNIAEDFEQFCRSNPKTCPLLCVADAGDPGFHALDENIDLRTDLPSYNIYKHGVLVDQVHDIRSFWRDDLVAFAIGCSFTFERALIAAGISMRHIDENATVPMYKTNLDLVPVGPFNGHAVVSMRPIKNADIPSVFEICSRYPHAHGEPIQAGSPEELGIADLDKPDWGDKVSLFEGETPVFWGCGVTTQVATIQAKADLCITHTPGCMLITDKDELSISDKRLS